MSGSRFLMHRPEVQAVGHWSCGPAESQPYLAAQKKTALNVEIRLKFSHGRSQPRTPSDQFYPPPLFLTRQIQMHASQRKERNVGGGMGKRSFMDGQGVSLFVGHVTTRLPSQLSRFPPTNSPPPTTTTDACRVMFLSNQSQIPKCASSPRFTLITFPSLQSPVRHATHLPESADTSIEPRLAPERLLPPSMTRDASLTPNESSL